jgi:hypothetical protein
MRRIALIGPLADERRMVHTSGYPMDPEQMLPPADVVLLVEDGKRGGAMLFRYTAHGELSGDTLHASAALAEAQAVFEYGDALFPWLEVPDDIKDAHLFAVKYAAEQLNGRD